MKKFCGGKINEIYSGTKSYADVNMMAHFLTSKNKLTIKLTMQSNDAHTTQTCEVHPDYPQLYLS